MDVVLEVLKVVLRIGYGFWANSLFFKASRQLRKTKGIAILDRTLLPFFVFFMRLFAPRYNAHIQFLIAQTRILRSRIDASRIVPTPEETEGRFQAIRKVAHSGVRQEDRAQDGGRERPLGHCPRSTKNSTIRSSGCLSSNLKSR